MPSSDLVDKVKVPDGEVEYLVSTLACESGGGSYVGYSQILVLNEFEKRLTSWVCVGASPGAVERVFVAAYDYWGVEV